MVGPQDMTDICSPLEADLHNHTTHSDGELTPTALVRHAAELGLRGLAVTDHDTIDGLEEACAAGRAHGIQVVCGVEVSVRFVEPFFRGTLHLLLYFDEALLGDRSFRDQTAQTLGKGRGPALTTDRIGAINAQFAPTGRSPLLPRPLAEGDVYAHGERISRRHFALALGDLGLTDRAVVNRVLGNDSPAYIPSGVPMGALRGYLQAWPVVRILAHPAAGSYPGEGVYKEVLPPLETVERLLPGFLELGLDGLELCYPAHTPALRARVEALRQRHGLPLVTGGSDCHDTSARPLGVAGVSLACLAELQAAIARVGTARRPS